MGWYDDWRKRLEQMKEKNEILRREREVRRDIIQQEREQAKVEKKFEEQAKELVEDEG